MLISQSILSATPDFAESDLSDAGLSGREVKALSQLSEQLQEMRSLAANFKQITLDEDDNLLQDVTGIIRVKRPQQFYQLAQQPYQHLVVSDGKVLWLYDIDLEQATKQQYIAAKGSIPALILSGEIGQLNERYTIARSVNNRQTHYSLNAHNEDAIFHQLDLIFDENVLISMSFQDDFNQLTKIDFSEIKLNGYIDNKLFNFTPPPGIDVIDETKSFSTNTGEHSISDGNKSIIP